MKWLIDTWRNSRAPAYIAVHGFDSTAPQGAVETWSLTKRHLIHSLKRSGNYVIVRATAVQDITI